MLVIRLIRRGKRNQPFFRIVVTEKQNSPKGGRFLESLGFLNPLTKEKKINTDRIKYWISVGAQPSDRIHNLLISEKIIEGKKKDVHSRKKKQEEDSQEKPAEEKTSTEEKISEEKLVEPEKKIEEEKVIEEKPAAEKPKEEKVDK